VVVCNDEAAALQSAGTRPCEKALTWPCEQKQTPDCMPRHSLTIQGNQYLTSNHCLSLGLAERGAVSAGAGGACSAGTDSESPPAAAGLADWSCAAAAPDGHTSAAAAGGAAGAAGDAAGEMFASKSSSSSSSSPCKEHTRSSKHTGYCTGHAVHQDF